MPRTVYSKGLAHEAEKTDNLQRNAPECLVIAIWAGLPAAKPGRLDRQPVVILHMTRRAVVSRVIRVQRRYAVRIRPIQLGGLVHFGEMFDVFAELYRTCTYFSHIEHVSRIRLVKISQIFIMCAENGPFIGFGS